MLITYTAREVMRHALHISRLDHILMERRRRRGQDIGHLDLRDRALVFGYIYRRGVWLNGKKDGALSGLGSNTEATLHLNEALSDTLSSLDITSLLDLGCGDFTWMERVDLGNIYYTGVDIVEPLISENQRRYQSDHRTFLHLDGVIDALPPADLILCREVLFHLSFSDGKSLLANIKRSGAKYLIMTSDTATSFNADVDTGDFRNLNLLKRPFNFPGMQRSPAIANGVPQRRMIKWISDDVVSPTRGLGLWRIPDL